MDTAYRVMSTVSVYRFAFANRPVGSGGGVVRTPRRSRKNSKPEKSYFGGANPHRPMHAVLGVF
jgi:hypothetical protein